MLSFEESNKFWEIVRTDRLESIPIEAAANDGRLKRVTRWLLQDPSYPDYSEEDDYDQVVGTVMDEYGLDEEQIIVVLNLCEDKVARELDGNSR